MFFFPLFLSLLKEIRKSWRAYGEMRGFEGRIDFVSGSVDEEAGIPGTAAPEGERQRKKAPRISTAGRRRLRDRLEEQLLLRLVVTVLTQLQQHRRFRQRAPTSAGLLLPEPRGQQRGLVVGHVAHSLCRRRHLRSLPTDASPEEQLGVPQPRRPGGGEAGDHLIEEVIAAGAASAVLELLESDVWRRHPLHVLAAPLHHLRHRI